MRGRLIFPFLAELRRLDTAAMASTDPDGAGPLTGGFDPDFKEPVLVDRDGDGIAERERTELPAIRVPCQVEPKVFEDLRMLASGDSPRSDISLVFHFKDLERLGLGRRARLRRGRETDPTSEPHPAASSIHHVPPKRGY